MERKSLVSLVLYSGFCLLSQILTCNKGEKKKVVIFKTSYKSSAFAILVVIPLFLLILFEGFLFGNFYFIVYSSYFSGRVFAACEETFSCAVLFFGAAT